MNFFDSVSSVCSVWSPPLPYGFFIVSSELTEKDFMRIKKNLKTIINSYSCVTCLLIIFYLFITISINCVLMSNVSYIFGIN